MKPSRVEAFSDGVLAIALTVLVLTIEAADPRGDLAHELLHLRPSYLAYALTVLVIGPVCYYGFRDGEIRFLTQQPAVDKSELSPTGGR